MNPATLLQAARSAYARGAYAESLRFLSDTDPWPEVLRNAALHLQVMSHYGLRQFQAAESLLRKHLQGAPLDARNWLVLGILQDRMQRPQDAIVSLKQAVSLGTGGHALEDALASAHAKCGDLALATRHGSRSLEIKDREASALPHTGRLRRTVAPPFDGRQPQRNVISFSLWGDNPKYVAGAVANMRRLPHVFPGWSGRFYVDDSVPSAALAELVSLGARIEFMPRPRFLEEGMFWRFAVSDDSGVDRFLVRDADSEIGPREAAAVRDWVASGRLFHVMRDHPAHSELMLGGMWGGVAGALPPMADLRAGFAMDNHSVLDQVFLRQRVWPLAKSSMLIHDDHHGVLDAQPFPKDAPRNPGFHVGMAIPRPNQPLSLTSRNPIRSEPPVAVIMAAYQAKPWIHEAVASILGQTHHHLQLVVVDDGSTDGTSDVLAEFSDPRVIVLEHGVNRGIAAALNTAIEHVLGTTQAEFVAVMDADDVALPSRLERSIHALRERPQCVLVGGGTALWSARSIQPHAPHLRPEMARIHLLSNPPVTHPAVMYRRSSLQAGVRYRTDYTEAPDYRLWVDMLAHGEIAAFPEVVLQYRLHERQASVVRRAQIMATANRIRLDYLALLGLDAAEVDAPAHLALVHPGNPLPPGGLEQVAAWSRRLLDWNRSSRRLMMPLLEQFCVGHLRMRGKLR